MTTIQLSPAWRHSLGGAILFCGLLSLAFAATPPSPVATAVSQGQCETAIKLVNAGAASNDKQAVFLGARMMDEGICVGPDPINAAKFFERAMVLGDERGSLDYAAMVGLGRGTAQDYERAGKICRAAGIDPQGRLSLYALGYACTLRSLVGRTGRLMLPANIFHHSSDPVTVELRPAQGKLTVLSTPHVARESDAATGSMMRRAQVDIAQILEQALREASASVPKPDMARLGDQPVEFALDLDMTLEGGEGVLSFDERHAGARGLLSSELQRTFSQTVGVGAKSSGP